MSRGRRAPQCPGTHQLPGAVAAEAEHGAIPGGQRQRPRPRPQRVPHPQRPQRRHRSAPRAHVTRKRAGRAPVPSAPPGASRPVFIAVRRSGSLCERSALSPGSAAARTRGTAAVPGQCGLSPARSGRSGRGSRWRRERGGSGEGAGREREGSARAPSGKEWGQRRPPQAQERRRRWAALQCPVKHGASFIKDLQGDGIRLCGFFALRFCTRMGTGPELWYRGAMRLGRGNPRHEDRLGGKFRELLYGE